MAGAEEDNICLNAAFSQKLQNMKTVWFKKFGWFFLPTSILGWITVLLFGFLLATVVMAANRNSHSVSDMLYGIFPYAVCCFYVVNWIGSNASE